MYHFQDVLALCGVNIHQERNAKHDMTQAVEMVAKEQGNLLSQDSLYF